MDKKVGKSMKGFLILLCVSIIGCTQPVKTTDQVSSQESSQIVSQTDYWIAWEAGKDIKDMRKIIFKKKQFIDENGNLQNKGTWIMESDQNQRWNGTSFIPLIP